MGICHEQHNHQSETEGLSVEAYVERTNRPRKNFEMLNRRFLTAAHLNGHGSELALHVCSNLLKPAEPGQHRSQLIEIILTAPESLASAPNSKPRSPF